MKLIVCMKQAPDPEGPRESFVINHATGKVEPRGIPPVLSLFDENALEAALRIKDTDPDNVRVTLLSLGKKVSGAVMLKALAAGADELVRVEDPLFESGLLDSRATARAIVAAIRHMGGGDIIFVGRQAADWNAGQTGIGIAHYLGIPAITFAKKIDIRDGCVLVERVASGGTEIVKSTLPCLIMAGNEAGELRYPGMKERRKAKNKEIADLKLDENETRSLPSNLIVLKRLMETTIKETDCLFIQGETPGEKGVNLAKQLKADGVIG